MLKTLTSKFFRETGFRFLSLVTLALILVLSGCAPESGDESGNSNSEPTQRYTSVQIQIADNQEQQNSFQAFNRTVSSNTFNDVTEVLVTVELNGKKIVTDEALIKVDNKWIGTLNTIPVGVNLSFKAVAKNNGGENIFSGSTAQLLTGINDKVVIKMETLDLTIEFPRITQIQVPKKIVVNTVNEIKTTVKGNSVRNKLNYSFAPAPNGGSFNPAAGEIGLAGTSGMIINEYHAPDVSDDYIHSITLDDGGVASITTRFKTKVVYEITAPEVVTLFGPVLTKVNVSRPYKEDKLDWTISVTDDKPESQLTYKWSFEGTSPGVTFQNPNVKNAVLLNYNQNVSGVVKLIITDSDEIATEINYTIRPLLYADDVETDQDNTAPVAKVKATQRITTGTLVSLSGKESSDADAGDTLSYNWMITEKPVGSQATLSSINTVETNFTADVDGTYKVRLTVDDGTTTNVDTVVINASTPLTKPTLRLVSVAGNSYKLSLDSPEIYASQNFETVGGFSVECTGFKFDTTYNDLEVKNMPLDTSNLLRIKRKVGAAPLLAGATLELIDFTCATVPVLQGTSTFSISYDQAQVSGVANIDLVNP